MNTPASDEKARASHTPVSDVVAIVPAAGVGKRMRAACPKQYLTINDKTLLEHTVHYLLAHPSISQVVVAIGAEDEYFQDTSLVNDERVIVTTGGRERADSVLAGLKVTNATWVMVHDAARPCVRHDDIDALILAATEHEDGALLASPVRDTMKRGNRENGVDSTVCREQLWHALTPQMFKRESLFTALESALARSLAVTDEASAIEFAGGSPKLVVGHADNIKVTQPEDLVLAAFFLTQRATQG
ncbi:2-C-methyl-D-erythritol 4-phosphate cytidylyltransferase [Enterovibrio norvegicus]|uniref:2-C-methyl-D-erythritol 4-phosphate cytidylyltransferase n=1 Tax=Enterovibrio norvegicus DSM 15893 TaxID=1121869 RepID=A0A1I5U6K7_9GAMM|nr:2-C-methyl-D-erythritol 4-phosphate cytidylyltransferase [Enterovibrio norvegicus]OEF51152.1 2-C-methyl-D-erythritol 4-phosphate cytidylyltransferase [Enterovibrio norvegicus]SFP90894.1 2-C-methyl-D-erythritol 4-phosphate cytidylyltransferase [Enterovibrio norvegicus DSM 15893]